MLFYRFIILLVLSATIILNAKSNLNTNIKLEQFLRDYTVAGGLNDPQYILKFYSDNVEEYFNNINVDKEFILKDTIKYYKRWPIRSYELVKYNILYKNNIEKLIVVLLKIKWRVK